MKWTAWRIWRHPKRALMRIEESENIETDLQQRLDEALSLLEQQRKETSVQSFRVSELSRRVADTEKRLTDEHSAHAATKLGLKKALDSLAEHKSVDEKLAEFNNELKKVEEMKRGYEKRITQLESRLADARKRLGEADDREMADSIDMQEATRRQALRRKRREMKESSPFKGSVQPPQPQNNPAQPTQIQNNTASLNTASRKAISLEEEVPFQENLLTSNPYQSGSPTVANPYKSGTSSYGIEPGEENSEPESRQDDPIPASAFTSPISDDKISGKPAEAAKKVADYLNALQSKRAGRRRDDWLSEPPVL